MSRKRCNRKVRTTVTNPIALAIAGACITDRSLLDRLRLMELSAVEAFRMGKATPDDWRAIADVMNIAETFVSMGIGPEVAPCCARVEEVLQATQARYAAAGSLTLTGMELQVIRDLVAWHDAQRTAVARSVYEAALTKTSNRIRSAHPSVKVLGP